jgi:transcriptional regulator with XRE-family HTH domain
MTLVVGTGTLMLPMVEKRRSNDPLPVLHPEFGKRVETYMQKFDYSNEEVAELIGKERGEMVRRYRAGQALPETETMRKLAKAFHTTPGELHYGDPKVPGVVTVPVADVTPDEQVILEAYRRLPRGAKKALRVRATELAEEFAPASSAVPFGKGRRRAD